jgi:hypothetical protein
MKKLFDVLVLTLAVNFVVLAVGVGWLYQSGRLNRAKAHAIREIVFPPSARAASTTQPSGSGTSLQDAATTQPILRLDELLARQTSGRSTAEQIEFLQRTFDAQTATLDRRQRELGDLERQVDLAKEQLARDRAAFDAERSALEAREQEASQLAADKGFQDSLARYQAMAGKQVKQIFMGLDDETVRRYLQAMEPRQAARVIKEFKTPDELARIQKVLEKMRLSQPATAPANPADAASASASSPPGQ